MRAADPVRQYAGKGQPGAVGRQSVRDGAEGLRHRPRVDQRQNGNAEQAGDVGGRWIAVEQPHDALDQDQVGIGSGARQADARVVLAAHAEVEVVARASAGDGVDLRVEEIGAALEDGDASSLARV